MKTKLIYAIAFTLLVQVANAQMIGLKGGVNMSNMAMSIDGTTYSPNSMTGFHFGPVIDFTLNKSFSLNTGLLYSLKGYDLKNVSDATMENASPLNGKAKLSYFDIPVNLAFKIPISSKFKFFIQAGPYMAMGIGGTIKKPSSATNNPIPIQDIYSYSILAKTDYGVGAGAGFEIGRMVYSVNYNYGLRNLNYEPYTHNVKGTLNVTSLEFSVAYMFGNLSSKIGK